MSDPLPFIVEPGYTTSDYIPNRGGNSYRLLHYPNGTVRFEHVCDRGDRGVIICAPALQIGNGHTLGYTPNQAGDMRPTVTPSILCPDCNTHGFITNGRWTDA